MPSSPHVSPIRVLIDHTEHVHHVLGAQPGVGDSLQERLVVLGMMVALTGRWMAHFYTWPKGDGELLYLLRLGFGAAMTIAIVLAIDAIRRRNFAAHGAWMIRAYAIAMGAGTQVLTHIPFFVLFGAPDELSRTVLMGSGWLINVAVAEWIIRKGKSDRRTNHGVLAPVRSNVQETEFARCASAGAL
jgi:hypothetical protein